MKLYNTAYLMVALLIGVLTSCDYLDDNEKRPSGPVSFGFSVAKRVESRLESDSLSTFSSVLVSISSADGELLYDKEHLDLFKFGGDYVSEVLQLSYGSYKIEEFFILDGSGEIALATPKEGSDLAQLVDDPCPIHFEVDAADSVTYIKPEVLSVDNSTPAEFGYVAFGYQPVGTFDFYVSAFVYEDSSAFTLTDASLFLSTSNGDSLNYELSAGPNRIRTISGAAEYYLTFIKSGYPNQMDTLTEDELTVYSGTSYNVYFGSEDCKDELVELDGLIAYFQANGSLEDVSGTYSVEFYNGAEFGSDYCEVSDRAFHATEANDLIIFNSLIDTLSKLQLGSVSFWFSPDSNQIGRSGALLGFANSDGTATLHSLYGTYWADNHLSFQLWKDGYSSNYAWSVECKDVILEAGQWYHVVLSQDGSQIKLWVNNVAGVERHAAQLMDRGAWIADIIGGVDKITFGHNTLLEYPNGNPETSIDGRFDNISFYNRALTTDEVQTLYNANRH